MAVKLSKKERREALRKGVRRSEKFQQDTKDDKGRYKKIFKSKYNSKLWKVSEEEHSIDIIPFIAGPDHPQFKEGEGTTCLDVFVHYGVGINENQVICINKTLNGDGEGLGKRCVICEEEARLREAGYEENKAEISKLMARRRCIYNIRCNDSSKEVSKGIQIFDASHHAVSKPLEGIAKNRKGETLYYADIEHGKSVVFTRSGTKLNTEYSGFQFEEREEDITDEVLDEVICLDQAVIWPTSEDVERMFLGDGAEDVSEDEDEDEEEVEEAPKTRRKRQIKEEVEEEEEEVEEEEAPSKPKAKAKSKAKGKCPNGHKFGIDCDETDDCLDCPSWDDCADAKKDV